MSEWGEYLIDQVNDALNDQWWDSWKFNGHVAPKFWFGDRVKFSSRSAVVVGMQWRSEDRTFHTALAKRGWSYGLIFSPVGGLQWVHEDSLVADDDQT